MSELHITCDMGSHSLHPTQVLCSAITPARQASTRFSYLSRMDG